MRMVVSYVVAGTSRFQRKVRVADAPEPADVVGPSMPLETTLNWAGTVAVRWNVALSVGWSLQAYQNAQECGSPAMTPPPLISGCQPLIAPE